MSRGGVLAAAFLLGAGVLSALRLLPADPSPTPPRPGASADANPAPGNGARLDAAPTLSGRPPAAQENARPTEGAAIRPEVRAALERIRQERVRVRPEDSGVAIVERLRDHEADLSELMRDFDATRSHVRTGSGHLTSFQSTGEATCVRLEDLPGDPCVIEFGEGRFLVKDNRFFGNPAERVRSIEIRGAGMDRTTLVLERDCLMVVMGALENFSLHDLTLVGGQALHARGEAAMAIERVRFREWQGSAAVEADGPAYLACRQCEFDCVDAPRRYAVSVRGSSVLCFEQCVFRDLAGAAVSGAELRAQVAFFTGCTFEASRAIDNDGQGFPRSGVRVRGGSVIYGRPWETEEQWRVDWGARGLAEVEDVEFRPMPVRCSVAELLEVLARVESLVEGRALGFSMLTPRRTANTPCHLYVLHEKQWRVGLFDVVVSPGPEVRVTPRYSFPIGKAPGLARVLALREALVRAGLPPETDVGDVGVEEIMDGEDPTYAFVIGKERPARWQIDATTGAVIRRP